MLYLGGTLFLLDKFADDTFLDILEQEQITYTILVPALCQRLLRHPKLGTSNKSSLNYVGITGGHLTLTFAQAITEKLSPQVYEAYASTDCGQIAMLKPADRAAHSDTVGQPIWAVLIKILDDDCQEVPTGELGEICLRSPMAIQGYYRNPEATEEFFRGGWCHTGDIGFLDSEGYMHVTGRKKNMIKSGGISIYPEEIEEVLSVYPGLAEVAVILAGILNGANPLKLGGAKSWHDPRALMESSDFARSVSPITRRQSLLKLWQACRAPAWAKSTEVNWRTDDRNSREVGL